MSNTDTITVPVAPVEQPPAPVLPPQNELIGAEAPAYVQQQAANAAAAAQQAANPTRTFTEQDIEAARTQEKDKVYGRLEEVTNKFQTLEQKLAAIEEEKAAREAEAAAAVEAQRKAEEEAELAQLSAKDQIAALRSEYDGRFQEMAEERQRAEALLEREREFQALQEYKNGRLQDPNIAQSVMPHLHPYITGSTQEEIEESIKRAAETSQRILGDVQAVQQQQYRQAPGVSTSAPTIGPAEVQESTRQLSAADIQAMSLADYARIRPAVGMRH